MMTRLNLLTGVAFVLAMLGLPPDARGDGGVVVHSFTGELRHLDVDRVEIERDGQTLQFGRSRGGTGVKLPRGAKVGDRVTVWYTLEARRISAFAPGAPSANPGSGAAGQRGGEAPAGKLIIDDRAFYDARNDATDAGVARVRRGG